MRFFLNMFPKLCQSLENFFEFDLLALLLTMTFQITKNYIFLL